MKLFVVLVYGPPCSGKSAVVEYLMARHDGLFRISADRIKWFASGYGKGHYRDEVARVILDMAASALSQGFSLLVEANATIHNRMWPGYLALAEQQEAAFHEIALEAPLQILDARLEQRVRYSVARRKKITLKDSADLRRRHEDYLAHKKPGIPIFDSSVFSVDEIAARIEAMVGLAPPVHQRPGPEQSILSSVSRNQFILLLYGPPCSGKSATVTCLMARHKGLYRVSPDRVKWFVSGYGGGPFRKEVSRIVLDMATSALGQGLSLVVEANARILKKMWPEYQALAMRKGVAYFELNLEAPLDLLKARLANRMARSLTSGQKHTLKDPEDLERRYNAYLAHKKEGTRTLDSSALSLDEIAEQVERMVGLPRITPIDQLQKELQ